MIIMLSRNARHFVDVKLMCDRSDSERDETDEHEHVVPALERRLVLGDARRASLSLSCHYTSIFLGGSGWREIRGLRL